MIEEELKSVAIGKVNVSIIKKSKQGPAENQEKEFKQESHTEKTDSSDKLETNVNSVSNIENVEFITKSEERNETYVCNKSYSSKKILDRHLRLIHLVEKSHICGKYGKEFDNKSELKGHILSEHEGKKLYRCSICNASFTRTKNMKMHIVLVHGNYKNLLNCKPKELLNMNLVHKLEKSQTCDQCGEKLDNKRELKVHILSVHERKKVYRCSICKAFFTEVDNKSLKMHLVSVHKKDKNLLNCETKELLNLNLVYEVEKSQSCEQCGQTFGCDICKTYFSIKSDLMNHIESEHVEIQGVSLQSEQSNLALLRI